MGSSCSTVLDALQPDASSLPGPSWTQELISYYGWCGLTPETRKRACMSPIGFPVSWDLLGRMAQVAGLLIPQLIRLCCRALSYSRPLKTPSLPQHLVWVGC